jgi:hypothetical protein
MIDTYRDATTARSARPRREPYEKPRMRTIELVAEEVLAVGCKLSIAPGGPIGATCTAASCFAEGS